MLEKRAYGQVGFRMPTLLNLRNSSFGKEKP